MPESQVITKESYVTQPEMLEVAPKKSSLFIGVPKETSFQETRVALTPSSVKLLADRGNRIYIESDAGKLSGYSDLEYAEAGGEIIHEPKKVFEAHIILKVAPPTNHEVEWLKTHQILFSPLHLPTMDYGHIHSLMNRRITALAYEYVKDAAGYFPIVRILSEIAGSSAILIAAELLSRVSSGKGLLLGGISALPPSKVVVLGAGVVGEYVARSAIGLGADVRVFDNNLYKLMRLQNNLGRRIYTSAIIPEILAKEIADADVVVGGIHAESGQAPIVVSEEMVANMEEGSVIIDISIDQGGCFETSDISSHNKPTFVKHGVTHYCVPNIAARVPRSASMAFSNVITTMLIKAHESGSFENLIRQREGVRHGVYLYKGKLTNEFLSNRFDMKYTNIDLIMAADF